MKGLGKLYEKVESSVRNLKTLDADPSSYGNLLAPLMQSFQTNWDFQFLENLNEVWLLSDLSKHLKIKIEAKEGSVSLGHFCTERVESNRDNRFTTSALLTSEESLQKTNRKCVYCNSINHPSWRCLKISNPQHKRTILKRYVLFYLFS